MTAPASQFYNTGPAYIWIGSGPFNFATPASNTWQFVGFTQRGLAIDIAPTYEDVEADYSGRMPADVMILGVEAHLSGNLSRYVESVLTYMASFGSAAYLGSGENNFLGSIIQNEGLDFPTLIQCPFYAKAVYSSTPSPMIPGFLFYSTYLSDPERFVASIRIKMPSIGLRSLPVFGTYSGSTFNKGAPFNAFQIGSVNVPTAATGSSSWPTVV